MSQHSNSAGSASWMLDSSTFIHVLMIEKIQILLLLRPSLFFAEYVYKIELGVNAKEDTRRHARRVVSQGKIGIKQLTIDDLDQIAAMSRPRRIGLGELACAIVAEREGGGVLCDDWKCRPFFQNQMSLAQWHSIEDLLIEAAEQRYLTEFELSELQAKLQENQYHCRRDLRFEYLSRLHNSSPKTV